MDDDPEQQQQQRHNEKVWQLNADAQTDSSWHSQNYFR
jgi:hypothetical protein